MAEKSTKILIFSEDEEIGNSLRRYFEHFHADADIIIKTNDVSLKSVIEETKKIMKYSKSFIIIDDFYNRPDNKWGGLSLLKRLKTFWFPYLPLSTNSKADNKSGNSSEKVQIIPILFLCADEVWRLEIAMLRAGNPAIFDENESFTYHLNITKATFFLKIPFEVSKFKEIISCALNCQFVSDRSKIKLLSAAMGYEEHHGH